VRVGRQRVSPVKGPAQAEIGTLELLPERVRTDVEAIAG
jgi:hypothetical protein